MNLQSCSTAKPEFPDGQRDSLISIAGTEIRQITYKGEPVVTFAMIDKVHGRPKDTAQKRFIDNRTRFEEGEDFVLVPHSQNSEFRSLGINIPNRGLTVLTRRGYLKITKSLNDDKAWEVFNEMIDRYFAVEAMAHPALPDFSDPRVLLGVMNHLQAQVAEKDAVIAEQGVRLQKLDRLEGAIGSMCITDAAKTLGIKRAQDLFEFMSARRWIFKRPGNRNWLAYQDKIQAGLMEHDDHPYIDDLGRERVSTRALVTAKGLVKLAELLEQPLH